MKVIAFLIFLMCACTSDKKTIGDTYFEGKIVYKTSAISKSPDVDVREVLRRAGDSSIFYFKEGNYRTFYNGENLVDEYYTKESGKYFIKTTRSDTISWFDQATPGEIIISYKITRKKEKIMGIECDELVTVYENKTMTYYFNPDTLKIDKDWYKDYKHLNKDFVSQQIGSLWLRCVMVYPQLIFTVTATSISHESVDKKLFELPRNAVLIEGSNK